MTDQKESNTSAPMVTLKGYEVNPRKRLHAFDSGASLAYEARDVQGNLFVALVADPKMIPRLGNIMAYDLLADTSLMRLMAHGVCDWRLDNAQRYIFIYRTSADTTLIDGNGFLKAKWRQPEILQCFIRPMAKILQEMKDRNFFHGAIRPDNIYFSPARSSEAIILGDCLSSQPSALQPVLYESLERAMADPMGRGMGASVDDVYAFGVTLAMMLRTQDALSGLSDEDIMKRKLELGSYVTIIGRERFSASILTLLRGVLHDEPEKRWGVEEINSWLDGGKSNPPQAGTRKKASRPMIFMGEKYFFANSLAMDIHKSPKELAEIVDNESLGQWLDKALSDKDTQDRYNEALERVAKNGRGNADYLVSCVRMALAPSFPIHYKGINFTYEGIGGLLASAMYQKKDLRAFYDILALNLAVSNLLLKGLPQNIVVMIMKRFESCRNSIKQDKMGFGVEFCVYQLCDDAFCMSPKLEKFLVRGRKEMLLAFEALSEAGGETGMFLDRHSVAMISVSDSNAVESALFDLNAVDRDRKILGNLKALASLQKRLGAGGMPATANVFLSNMSGVYKKFHNKGLRKKIEEMVSMAAKIGDLAGMEAAIENVRVVQKDQIEFRRARQEYINLTNEYINLIQRMQNKAGFGVTKGRDVAAIISWMIATLMTIMVVLAFLSGNHIF